MSHEVPQRPWEKVAVGRLTRDQKDYLVTMITTVDLGTGQATYN